MAASSPEPRKSELATRLRDTLARNRKVCRELKEAVENCVAKVTGVDCDAERASEDTQSAG